MEDTEVKSKLNQISGFLTSCQTEMMELWKKLVNMESFTENIAAVNYIGEVIRDLFEQEGFTCQLKNVGAAGKMLVGIQGADRPGKSILFTGHLDTAIPPGALGENPFRIEDDKAYGPGVLDMKGGIVITLYIVKALNKIGYKEHPIKIIFSGDEESGHYSSEGAALLQKEAAGGLAAFHMITGLEDNCLCTGRKGSLACRMKISGNASHAGNDFLSGRNAIEEAAHKILRIQGLTDIAQGTTVSVATIHGGTIPSAIPGECCMEVDGRFTRAEEYMRLMETLRGIASQTYVEGTKTEIEFFRYAPIYETTESVLKFYNYICETAKAYQFAQPGHKTLGGFSDAAYVGMAGIPVICSCGVRGSGNHTRKEYAIVSSLFERTKLLLACVLNMGHLDFN